MATRCATIVRQLTDYGTEREVEELFRFYRHWDGYPSCHGAMMAQACIDANEDKGLNNRNWCQHVMAHMFADQADIEVEPKDAQHGDLDFLYAVTGYYAAYGGKVGIDELPVIFEVWYSHYGADYEETMRGEPLFRGNAREFLEWAESE